jgi:hypothetical protein
LETVAKLLKLLGRGLAVFSKCALKSLDNQADFDSAIRARTLPALFEFVRAVGKCAVT